MNELTEKQIIEESFSQERLSAVRFCQNCGEQLNTEQKFCHSCGKATSVKKSLSEEKRIRSHKKQKIISIVKSSVILAMAIIVLLSAFLPLVKCKDDFSDIGLTDYKITVKFNSIDAIKIFIASFDKLDESDTLELLEELLQEALEYANDWEDGEELDELSRLAKNAIFMLVRSEEFRVTPGIVFTGILSILQIAVSVALVIFSALSLAAQFTGKVKDFSLLSFILLGLSAIITFTNIYSLKSSFGLTDISFKTTGIQISALLFTVLTVLAFAGLNIFLNKKISVGNTIKRTLATSFAVVLLCSTFAPIVNTEIKALLKNNDEETRVTAALDSSLFSYLTVSEQQIENLENSKKSDIKNIAKTTFEGFSSYTKREFKKGEADAINKTMYSQLLLYFGGYEFFGVFQLGAVALILTVLCALFTIWQNMFEPATGKKIHTAVSLSIKILSVISAATILALAIVMSVIVSNNADVIGIIYKSKISFGPILMMIFSIAVLCTPSAKQIKEI